MSNCHSFMITFFSVVKIAALKAALHTEIITKKSVEKIRYKILTIDATKFSENILLSFYVIIFL
jgi:hypothetical protein